MKRGKMNSEKGEDVWKSVSESGKGRKEEKECENLCCLDARKVS